MVELFSEGINFVHLRGRSSQVVKGAAWEKINEKTTIPGSPPACSIVPRIASYLSEVRIVLYPWRASRKKLLAEPLRFCQVVNWGHFAPKKGRPAKVSLVQRSWRQTSCVTKWLPGDEMKVDFFSSKWKWTLQFKNLRGKKFQRTQVKHLIGPNV